MLVVVAAIAEANIIAGWALIMPADWAEGNSVFLLPIGKRAFAILDWAIVCCLWHD